MKDSFFSRVNVLKMKGAPPRQLEGICYDSRQARPGYAFVALRGTKSDGHDFVEEAMARGASTVVVEKEPPGPIPEGVTMVIVTDSRGALARLAEYYYDKPSRKLRLIGVTGTNGKTTVTYILASIIAAAGGRSGRIGTVDYDIMGQSRPSSNTTPESADLQKMMKEIVDLGGQYCMLEVSSHALDQRRVERLRFHEAIFTNLTQDHMDYHGDMNTYFSAKALLFTRHSPQVAIINTDDPWGQKLLPMIQGKKVTYGMEGKADVRAREVAMTISGLKMKLVTPQGEVAIKSGMVGRHNVYNILASAAAALADGISLGHIAEGVEKCQGAPGRFEKVDRGQPFTVVVDYAHTEDAIKNILAAAREVGPKRIITMFGCGGDRDKIKRPLMGRAAWNNSDMVIVTSDNPRTEDPNAIIGDILKGIPEAGREEKLAVMPDRAEAIKAAVSLAQPGDMVILAGKGHEDYQIIGMEKTHFDDREQAGRVLEEIYGKV
ncbi:MAG: UDP-N-acetylmuramoyl-L-alanyl-D-glutamate--2,6-diaminopimelate ligase [Nitrospinota bacterium]|nr:UDP-N-acetylmuramoyl-L-alanyl-D-glutamate--2,6-diaminopimelate ligase [Nitrospinota bacterium]